MNHVDLFSGIGGFSLAAEWAGFTTVLFVEKDDYCQKVLKKHWPNVPCIGDIRDVNEETVADAANKRQGSGASKRWSIEDRQRWDAVGIEPVGRGSGQVATAEGLPTIDLLTGGFPCQPFSVAGKRGGASDDRFLWPEMLRVIELLKPRWILAENVAGIINMALDDVLSDLEGKGYETGTVVLPACSKNAPHRRDRCWIMAHAKRTGTGSDSGEAGDKGRRTGTDRREGLRQGEWPSGAGGIDTAGADEAGVVALSTSDGLNRQELREFQGNHGAASTGTEYATETSRPQPLGTMEGCEAVPDTTGDRGEARLSGQVAWQEGNAREPVNGGCERGWQGQEAESRLRGMDDELPARVDGHWWDSEWKGVPHVTTETRNRTNRLKCLGNAIVPAVAFEILRYMK